MGEKKRDFGLINFGFISARGVFCFLWVGEYAFRGGKMG